eukprot:scaffold17835_cov58-Phaeocystis_antarctica.AAC.6
MSLPAESKGGNAMRGSCGPGRRASGGASGMQGVWARLIAGQGTRGAHRKHAVHVRDAGRVEAQRLVEGQRAPEHVLHGCDAGRVEAQRLVERRRVGEHVLHVRDAGRVEAQRLVEHRRGGEHVGHVRDAGRVEAQRLVECRRPELT